MKKWMLRLFLPLALVLAVGSCDPVPTAPEPDVAPLFHAGHDDGAKIVDADGKEYDPVYGDLPNDEQRFIASLIGSLGGSLELAGHTLVVPAGAVPEPTLFTMQVFDDGWVEVELRATLIKRVVRWLFGIINQVIDVGSLGFDKPVTVEISYAYATNVEDPTKLVLLRMQDDDPDHTKPHELIPSEVDTQKRVVRAKLDHFTKYCLASN